MDPSSKKYQALIRRLPLRPLKSEQDLDAALQLSIELNEKFQTLDEGEKDYLEMLTQVIQSYEQKFYQIEDSAKPHEVLKELLEQNNMIQKDLRVLLGVPSGRASELVRGERELSKEQIMTLCLRFKVEPSLFLPKQKSTDISETYKTEPVPSFQTVCESIDFVIAEARNSNKTYLCDCDGLLMTITRSSKIDELMNAYDKFIQASDKKPESKLSIRYFD